MSISLRTKACMYLGCTCFLSSVLPHFRVFHVFLFSSVLLSLFLTLLWFSLSECVPVSWCRSTLNFGPVTVTRYLSDCSVIINVSSSQFSCSTLPVVTLGPSNWTRLVTSSTWGWSWTGPEPCINPLQSLLYMEVEYLCWADVSNWHPSHVFNVFLWKTCRSGSTTAFQHPTVSWQAQEKA